MLNLIKGEKMNFNDGVIHFMRYERATDKTNMPIEDVGRTDIPNGLRMIIKEF